MMFFLLLAGFLVLLAGAEFLVRGAVGVAAQLNVSKLVVGLTAVAFGTSAPELVVGITATLDDAPAIVIGNVVGSNVCNILLVLGLTAAVRPIVCTTPWLIRDGASVVGATVLTIGLAWLGPFGWLDGLLLVTLLTAFLYYCYRTERRAPPEQTHASEVDEVEHVPKTLGRSALILVTGIVGVVAGSELLVDGAVDIARHFGISESVIGLTLIAFGTSLPELATSMVAAFRGHNEIAAGNILGSNLFNILAVLGISSLIAPIPVPEGMLSFDFWVMLGAVLVLVPYMITGAPIRRGVGALFFAAYIGFVVAQFLGISAMPNAMAALPAVIGIR